MTLSGTTLAILFGAPALGGIPAGDGCVRHAAEFAFPHALPGTRMRIEKVLDARTGRHWLRSSSAHVLEGSDLARLEGAEAELERKRHGALARRLRAKARGGPGGRKLVVVVHLKEPEGVLYLDKTRHTMRALEDQSRTVALGLPHLAFMELAARHGIARWEPRGKTSFRCLVEAVALASLRFDPAVAEIEEFRMEAPLLAGSLPLAALAASAWSHGTKAPPSYAGAGIGAATFETGIDPGVMACFGSLDGSRIEQRLKPWPHWEHSHATFRALQGAAPGADLWHRNSVRYDNLGDSTWIIDHAIRSTSLSYSRDDANPYDATYKEFRVMDDFAYRYPFPLFVTPTANSGYRYASNWQGYNGISVGNVRHSNRSHFELVDTLDPRGGCTQTRNPFPRYGLFRDREMPQVVAPGHAPGPGHDLREGCVGNDTIACGTSLSAPIANGIAAGILAADSRIQGWPEKVRVVMMATALNVDRGYWSYASDGRDGAGVLHGEGAVRFAREHATVYPDNAAVTRGLSAGSLSAADFAGPNPPIVFNILIPDPKPAGMHLRVVLSWDSNPSLNLPGNSLSDLDLLVTSGLTGRASQSFNGSNEVVEIPADLFPAGAVVQARISKVVNRIPPIGTRANFFYYAVGWNWVADHAP